MKQIKYYFFVAIFFLLSKQPFGSAELEEAAAAKSSSFECLIVDDLPVNRRFLGNMLKKATQSMGGIILHYAESEEKAKTILAESPSINLVVSDGEITLGIGGTKLVTDIRSTFKGFIVAWSTDPTEQAGMMAAGANYDLTKPGTLKDIKRMLSAFDESLSTKALL